MLLQSYGRAVAALLIFLSSTTMTVAEGANFKLELCKSCHGEIGNPQMPGVPSLAGRTASELASQLKLFRSGQRQNPQMVMAKRLTDEEIEALTAFFAKQSPK